MTSNNDLVKAEIRAGLQIGDIVESLENGTWYKERAKIVKVVKPGDQVRIHYLGWKAKWDKEIKLTSPSVRYDKSKSKSKATITTGSYKIGQKVMATFTDGQKYPAEIRAVNSSGSYQVKFYDGFKKNVFESGLEKFSEKANREAKLKADELYGQKLVPEINSDEEEKEGRSSRRRSHMAKVEADSPRSTPRRSRSTTPLPESKTPKLSKTPKRRNTRMTPREIKNEEVKVENEPEIEIVSITSDVFEFDEKPPEKVAIKKPKREDIFSLLGANGIGQTLSVFRQGEWHEAKVIAPPKSGAKATPPKKDQFVFVHYKGWNKQYDEWAELKAETMKIIKVENIEIKHNFKVGANVLGTWTDKKYYPCSIVALIPTGYQVEFYDGFKKKLTFQQVKRGTEIEKKKALAEAEIEFGAKLEDSKKGRKSIFKRDKSGESQTDPDVKRMILGQKRPRPNSISLSPKSSPKASSKPALSKLPKPKMIESPASAPPAEKRSRRSTRGNPVVEEVKEKITERAEKAKNNEIKKTPDVKKTETRTRSRLSVTPKPEVIEPPKKAARVEPSKVSTQTPKKNQTPSKEVMSESIPEPTPPPPQKEFEVSNPAAIVDDDDLSEIERRIQERKRLVAEDERIMAELVAKKKAEKDRQEKREQDIQRLTPGQLAIYNSLKAKLSEVESDNMLFGFLQPVAPPTPPHKSPSPAKSPHVVACKTPKLPEKEKDESTHQGRKRKTRNDSNTTGRKGPG